MTRSLRAAERASNSGTSNRALACSIASPSPKPQGMKTTTSGSASAISVQVHEREGAPGTPSNSRPPARLTISGIQ
jgi:hypothetical protein